MVTASVPGAGRNTLATWPNILTAGRLLLSFAMFALIAYKLWAAAFLIFVLAGISDWLDGYLARKLNQSSAFGRAFDPVVDKVMILGAFVFLMDVRDPPLAGGAGWTPTMFVVVLTRDFLISALRAMLEASGRAFGADWLGKLKTVFECAALGWILAAFALSESGVALPWAEYVRDFCNAGVIVTTVVSGINYAVAAARPRG